MKNQDVPLLVFSMVALGLVAGLMIGASHGPFQAGPATTQVTRVVPATLANLAKKHAIVDYDEFYSDGKLYSTTLDVRDGDVSTVYRNKAVAKVLEVK